MIIEKVESGLYLLSAISLRKLFISSPTRFCVVIYFNTLIVYYVIQREYHNNMVFDDVDTGSKVIFYDSKVYTKEYDSVLCMRKLVNIMLYFR